MRKSVITGIFACAILPLVSSVKADAASVDLVNVNSSETSVVQMLDEVDGVLFVTELNANNLNDPVKEPVAAEVPAVIAHTVLENETLSDIALLHSTTWKRIYDKNVTVENPDVINPEDALVIPTADEVLEERELPQPLPEVVRAKPAVKETSNSRVKTEKGARVAARTAPVASSGNRYVAGYCTWYVKNQRPDLPNSLGNAETWVSRAAALGLNTGSTPAAGAVGQQGNHVVYVNSVNGDGTVTISEMNLKGWNITSSRTVAASNFRYIY